MAKKKYLVTVQHEVEIDSAVLAEARKPEWQSYIGKMTELEVAQYIGFNLVANACTLTQVDGFADRKDSEARTVGRPDCYVEKVGAKPRARRSEGR
jgi:hypothetical protein